MTRVADAYRKRGSAALRAGAVSFGPGSAAGAEALVTTQIPWDLDISTMPGGARHEGHQADATTQPPHASSGVVGKLDTGARHKWRSSTADPECREQLMLIVERVVAERLHSIVFTAIDSDRRANVCSPAAEALADETSGSVCLVDADLRSPSLHESYGLSGKNGLSDFLSGELGLRACVTPIARNLSLVAAGTLCDGDRVTRLFSRERMRPRLAELRAAFDYVVVNTPPASEYGDAIALGSMVDGMILMLDANATRREVAKRTAAQCSAASVRIVGAVLMNRTFPIPNAIYRRL